MSDGQSIPSALTVAIAGSNTTEKTHAYAAIHTTAVVHLKNGVAEPLTVTLPLPDTTWHPTGKTEPVIFTQTSALVTATLDLYGTPITATFNCSVAHPNPFLALSAAGPPPTTTTTIKAESVPTTTTTVMVAPQAASSLPRTGGKTLLLLVGATALIDLGLALWAIARPKRHHI